MKNNGRLVLFAHLTKALVSRVHHFSPFCSFFLEFFFLLRSIESRFQHCPMLKSLPEGNIDSHLFCKLLIKLMKENCQLKLKEKRKRTMKNTTPKYRKEKRKDEKRDERRRRRRRGTTTMMANGIKLLTNLFVANFKFC